MLRDWLILAGVALAVVLVVTACVAGSVFGWFAFSAEGDTQPPCACDAHPMAFETDEAIYTINILCRKFEKGPGEEAPPRVPPADYNLDDLDDPSYGPSLRH